MRTGAVFRLSGGGGATSAAVTRLLGIEPTLAFEAGDPTGSRSTSVRRSSLWLLESELPQDVELGAHLSLLLDRLEPAADALWQLDGRGNSADWFCLVASHATEHAVELDRPLLRRLVGLPGDLRLDVMGDEDD